MTYPQIEKIIKAGGGEVSVEGVHVAYRHEQPWGVPCTLDFFREKWLEDKSGKYKARLFPEGVDAFIYRVVEMVKEAIKPPSGIILASGPSGISLLWRMTVEEKAVVAAAKGEQHGNRE